MKEQVAQRLRAAAQELQAERVSVAELLHAHGPAAHGSLLLLMAVPCMLPIPGTGTVLGLGLLAMAWAMWRGRAEGHTLPQRVAEFQMSTALARRVLTTLASFYAMAARLTRVRLGWVLDGAIHRALAIAVAAMAVVLILPIPFGNVLPALALVMIGLGLVFRDGLPVVLGVATSVITVVGMLVLAVMAAEWGLDLALGL